MRGARGLWLLTLVGAIGAVSAWAVESAALCPESLTRLDEQQNFKSLGISSLKRLAIVGGLTDVCMEEHPGGLRDRAEICKANADYVVNTVQMLVGNRQETLPEKVEFPAELSELLRSGETLEFLKDLYSWLNSVEMGAPGERNLWKWTLAQPAIHGDPAKAIQMLGVLFQDYTVPDALNPDLPPVAIYRAALNKLINHWQKGDIALYPEPIPNGKAPFYHFYTIAYISMRLGEAHQNPTEGAAMAYWLNRSYAEWHQSESFSQLSKPVMAHIRRKNGTNQGTRESRMEPEMPVLYLGLAGAKFGASPNSEALRSLPDLAQYSADYRSMSEATLTQKLIFQK